MLFSKTTYECNDVTFTGGEEVKIKIYDHCKNENPYLGEDVYFGQISNLESETFDLFTDEFCITIKVDDVELMEERYK